MTTIVSKELTDALVPIEGRNVDKEPSECLQRVEDDVTTSQEHPEGQHDNHRPTDGLWDREHALATPSLARITSNHHNPSLQRCTANTVSLG